MNIVEELFKLQDEEYGNFHAKLVPTVQRETIIGVRVPNIRKLARLLKNSPEQKEFLQCLPHRYYEENMLHGILISQIKDYDDCISHLDAFLPFVDNWAVCDSMSPKCFAKNKEKLIKDAERWISSHKVYTCRFGIGMLMAHFLDEDFREEYADAVARIRSDEYYVNMMIAWYFATALAKQWEKIIPYIENRRLSVWTGNKAIQKAVESYRITPEQKTYLRTLRVK